MGALAACSGQNEAASAVAASGEGVTVMEDDVTKTIQTNRSSYGLEDEEGWANALIEAELTPQSYRENIINSMADQQLLKSGAEKLGITVSDDEIKTHVDSIKKDLGIESDEDWAEALERAGFTEDSYRQNITDQIIQQNVAEHFQEEAKVDDKELLESAQDYVTYYDGAKRTSHILIGVDDKTDEAAMKAAREKAQGLLDQINNGADFAELAKENSTDKGSAARGGDVGWDVLNSFVTEYTDAIDSLDKGEVSDLVESEFGIHIIKVTDVFNAPEKLKKISDLPEEFQTAVTNMAKQVKANEDYENWLKGLREAANITINEMPADVPYNVDLEKYRSASAASAEAEGDDDENAATADGDEPDENGEEVEVDMEDLENGEEVEVEAEGSSEAAASSDAAASSEAASSASAESAGSEAK